MEQDSEDSRSHFSVSEGVPDPREVTLQIDCLINQIQNMENVIFQQRELIHQMIMHFGQLQNRMDFMEELVPMPKETCQESYP